MQDKNTFGAEFIDYSYAGTVWGRLFDEKRNLVYEGNIKYRKAYGYGTSYFPNGTKYQEGIFNVKGLVSGKEFYPNGQLRFEGTYEINNAYGPNYPNRNFIVGGDANDKQQVGQQRIPLYPHSQRTAFELQTISGGGAALCVHQKISRAVWRD